MASASGEQLVIERNGAVLVDDLERAVTPLGRALGLMFRSSLEETSGLWLEPCNSIHMLFMRFPIDVVWLDSKNVVIKVSSNVRAWIGMAACWSARVALELPAGRARDVKLGDRIVRNI